MIDAVASRFLPPPFGGGAVGGGCVTQGSARASLHPGLRARRPIRGCNGADGLPMCLACNTHHLGSLPAKIFKNFRICFSTEWGNHSPMLGCISLAIEFVTHFQRLIGGVRPVSRGGATLCPELSCYGPSGQTYEVHQTRSDLSSVKSMDTITFWLRLCRAGITIHRPGDFPGHCAGLSS
jgi:hypothetical protein